MLVCTPTPAIEAVVLVERLEAGSTPEPLDSLVVAGGDGLCVARAAAALGARDVTAAFPTGGAGGGRMQGVVDELVAAGIDVVAVPSPGEPSVVVRVVERATGRTTVLRTRASECDRVTWSSLAGAVADTAGWTMLVGATPAGSAPERWAECAAAASGPLAVCADAAAVTRLAASGPALVVVDAATSTTVSGVAVDGVDTAVLCADEIMRRAGGTGAIALLREPGDLVVVEPDGSVWRVTGEVPGPFASASTAVCGAALVTAREMGASWPDAAAFAAGAVAVAAEHPYPGRCDAERAGAAASAVVVRRLRDPMSST